MFVFRPFLIALQFLTVFPIRLKTVPDNRAVGRSLLYYPLVGLLIGLLLAMIGWLGSGLSGSLHAAIILACWVALTGALHLDGLADSADGWIGGLGDRQKTLTIMKDPCCGPAAVVTLVLVLLIKFAALEQLITTANWGALILAPLLGRTALILLFLTTPYLRNNGLGTQLANHLPRRASMITVFITLAAVPIVFGTSSFWLLFTLAGTFLLLRALMLRRIGGATGDTAGASVELIETAMLFSATLIMT